MKLKKTPGFPGVNVSCRSYDGAFINVYSNNILLVIYIMLFLKDGMTVSITGEMSIKPDLDANNRPRISYFMVPDKIEPVVGLKDRDRTVLDVPLVNVAYNYKVDKKRLQCMLVHMVDCGLVSNLSVEEQVDLEERVEFLSKECGYGRLAEKEWTEHKNELEAGLIEMNSEMAQGRTVGGLKRKIRDLEDELKIVRSNERKAREELGTAFRNFENYKKAGELRAGLAGLTVDVSNPEEISIGASDSAGEAEFVGASEDLRDAEDNYEL